MSWFGNLFGGEGNGGKEDKSNGKQPNTPVQPKTPAKPKTPGVGKTPAQPKTPPKDQPKTKPGVTKAPQKLTKDEQKMKATNDEKKTPPKEDKTPPKEDKTPPKEDKKPPKEDKKPPKKDADNKKEDKKQRAQKTKSLESVFNTSDRSEGTTYQFGSRLSPLNNTPPGQTLFDVSAYLIHCPQHNKIAVGIEEKTKYIWLPFISLPSTRTWTEGVLDGANIVLSAGDANAYLALQKNSVISETEPIELFRLQLPQNQNFNIRIIIYIKLNPKSGFKCCSDTRRLRWLPVQDVQQSKVDNLFGPELVDMADKLVKGKIGLTILEYSLDEAFRYVPRDPPRNLEEEMLRSTNFTEKDVERLYSDFIDHCFPSFYMTQTSFSDYMSKYGFEKMDRKLELLYRAFNFRNNGFLSFHEFLLGLTSIDPTAINGQSRIKFVFKYFDLDGDGYLNLDEFTSLIREIYPKDSDSDIKKKVKQHMKAIGIKNNGVHFNDFFKAVGAHKFRGTSGLCRSNRPIVQQISSSIATRALRKPSGKSDLGSILTDCKYKGICESCKEKKYEFAIHSIRMNSEGHCYGAKTLPELTQIEKQENKVSKEKIETVKTSGSNTGVITFSHEKFSNEVLWNPKSVANHLIDLIRDFNTKKGSHKSNKGVMDGPSERAPFVKKLKELCAEVEKIVAQEERCIRVSSPAFVIGDIHGNIEDMFTMERVLWKNAPILSASYVFLGDYVDRGKWGLECALYLMCLKLLAPNKFVLLRGNHEVRDLQKHYTYRKECCNKYGDSLRNEVFEATNRVFDKLPFCAVIDDAIFCAHGGIPASTRQIEKINEVKADLKNPEKESSIAWEILWSDPIGAQQFAQAADLLKVRVDSAHGFLTNAKRGTGFLFSEEAANTFLQSNGLTHIIRAHEVPAQGYTFHFGNKCTTVFSSSHYSGNSNEAAAIHIDNEKLRIVRLDTVNNAPASD